MRRPSRMTPNLTAVDGLVEPVAAKADELGGFVDRGAQTLQPRTLAARPPCNSQRTDET